MMAEYICTTVPDQEIDFGRNSQKTWPQERRFNDGIGNTGTWRCIFFSYQRKYTAYLIASIYLTLHIFVVINNLHHFPTGTIR